MVLPLLGVVLGLTPLLTIRSRGVRGTASSPALETIQHYESYPILPDPHDNDLHAQFLSLLTPNRESHMLDVGFGSGRCIEAFLAAGHRVTAFDACQRYIHAAQEKLADNDTKVKLIHADLHKPFPESVRSESYDAVFAARSLFHVSRPLLPSVLADLHELCRPGGVFFCLQAHAPGFTDEEDWGCDGDRRYGHFQTIESWTCLCEAAGFALIDRYQWPRPSLSGPVDIGDGDESKSMSSTVWVTVWRRNG